MQQFLRYGIIRGLFAVLFIPFIVSSSMFFPFITGKVFAFRILVEILFGLWLILAMMNKTYRPKFSYIAAAFSAFIIIVFFADIFGENPFKSFWSNFERMEGFWTLLHVFLFFIAAGTMLRGENIWRRFLETSVGASVAMGIYGFFQLAGAITINQGGVRLDGTFGNASYLAVYMLFHVFFTLFLLARYGRRSSVSARTFYIGALIVSARTFYIGALIVQLIALYYTASRGVILGLGVGLFITAIITAIFERRHTVLRRAAIGLLAVVVAAGGTFLLVRNTEFVRQSPVLQRFASISLDEGKPRFIIWSMAWEGVKERPLLGWGQENFNFVFNKEYDPRLFSQEPWFDRAHNAVFDWMVASGFLGLTAYLSLFGGALYYLWLRHGLDREQSWIVRIKSLLESKHPTDQLSVSERAIITGLLGGYFFQNLFVFDNIASYILFAAVLAFIHQESADQIPAFQKIGEWKRVKVVAAAAVVIAVIVAGSVYWINIRGIQVSQKIIRSLGSPDLELTERLRLLKEAYNADTIGRQEVVEQTMQFAIQVHGSDVPKNIKDQFVSFARQAIDEELERNPTDARLLMFKGSALGSMGFLEEAIEAFSKARSHSPSKQLIHSALGSLYSTNGDAGKATEAFKKAYELDRRNVRAGYHYAVALARAGEFNAVEELLEKDEKIYGQFDGTIVGPYAERGAYGRIRPLLERAIVEQPKNANIHTSLAAVYIELGLRQEAIESLQDAKELNPKDKDQYDYWISEIRAGRNP